MKAFLLLSIISLIPTTAATPKTWYGRVFDSNIYFYSSPVDDNEHIMFAIEPSYFVELTADFNSTFYSAKYMGLSGFVKKKDVQPTSDTIKNPYPSQIFFRVYLPISQVMYSAPSTSADIVVQIPIYTKTLNYIGSSFGEVAIVERSNKWYFCKYTLDKEYFGYIYSEGVDQLSNIPKNIEECSYVEFADFSAPSTNLSVVSTSSKSFNLIVVLSCLGVGVFIILVAKSGIILHSKQEKKEVTNFLDN